MTESVDQAELTAKVERARQSYQEVLDATKHQDDKINRVLVGIAFLTTGAIAFLFRNDVVATAWTFGSHRVPFVAVMAGCYFALTMAAVVLLLLSLSSELRLPRGGQQEDLQNSYLYFTFIAGRTKNSWLREWKRRSQDVDERLLDQYQRETYNIAQRARLKYGRTDEAAALFVLALMFLAAGFLLALAAVAQPAAGTVGFAWTSALLVGGVFSGHALLQLWTLHRYEQQSVELVWRIRRQDPGDAAAWMDRRRRNGMRWLLGAVPVYIVSMVLLTVATDRPGRALLALLPLLAVFVGYRGMAPRWHLRTDQHLSLRRTGAGAWPYAGVAAAAAVMAVLSGLFSEPWLPLTAAAAVPVLLSTITVGRQLSIARKVAALADPGNLARKEEIDDQLLPVTAPPPGNVGDTGQNESRSGRDGEAASMTATTRGRTESAEEVVTSMLGHTPPAGSVIYVSQPITTGPVYVGLRRASVLDEDVLRVAAKHANRDSSRALITRVRSSYAGEDVIDPSDYEDDGLDQHGYHSLWTEVITAFGRVVVLADGWQFSVGCCVELATALRHGLEVRDAALAPLSPVAAADLISAAVPELEEAGVDVTPIRRALDSARSAAS